MDSGVVAKPVTARYGAAPGICSWCSLRLKTTAWTGLIADWIFLFRTRGDMDIVRGGNWKIRLQGTRRGAVAVFRVRPVPFGPFDTSVSAVPQNTARTVGILAIHAQF